MKRLTIMRHAKSSWEFPELSDFERPLIEKGIKRTLRTCRFLHEKQLYPDTIFSSPALRAKDTAMLVAKNLPVTHEIQWIEPFYPGNPAAFIKQLSKADNSLNHILVIGHNPGLSNFACLLLNSTETDWIPTSGCAIIDIDIEKWEEPFAAKGKLLHYIKPKELAKKYKK